MNITSIVQILRPLHWFKNVFVFLPMFFNGSLLDLTCWTQAAIVFIAFSLMSSAVYCFNDICDVKLDRMHYAKRFRPIANNEISVRTAYMIMAVLICLSIIICMQTGVKSMSVIGILGIYFLMNLTYCIKLKQYAIIDVFIISFGFVLRLVAGGIACDIWLSPWIISMTLLIALFLAFAKRRDDVVVREKTGQVIRSNTVNYNLDFLNQVLGLIGAITIVCYIIYTVSPEVEIRLGSEYIYITSIFVLAGILRYLQLAIVFINSGSPTKILLKDHFIQCCIMAWWIAFFIIIYL